MKYKNVRENISLDVLRRLVKIYEGLPPRGLLTDPDEATCPICREAETVMNQEYSMKLYTNLPLHIRICRCCPIFQTTGDPDNYYLCDHCLKGWTRRITTNRAKARFLTRLLERMAAGGGK